MRDVGVVVNFSSANTSNDTNSVRKSTTEITTVLNVLGGWCESAALGRVLELNDRLTASRACALEEWYLSHTATRQTIVVSTSSTAVAVAIHRDAKSAHRLWHGALEDDRNGRTVAFTRLTLSSRRLIDSLALSTIASRKATRRNSSRTVTSARIENLSTTTLS